MFNLKCKSNTLCLMNNCQEALPWRATGLQIFHRQNTILSDAYCDGDDDDG